MAIHLSPLHRLVVYICSLILIANLWCHYLIPEETQNAMHLFTDNARPLPAPDGWDIFPASGLTHSPGRVSQLPLDMRCIVPATEKSDCSIVEISSYEFNECGPPTDTLSSIHPDASLRKISHHVLTSQVHIVQLIFVAPI